ncbi:MAG TPA: response regulator [Candidatus Limnocylindrales bacterium]|nr:response regulator [Candidatus Limnocylindrales bacterium]
MNPVTLLVELIFLGLFVATLVSYLRRRDALTRDVMLIFASLAGLFLVAGLGAILGDLPGPIIGIAFALLLAQPLFTLRLANRLRPIAAPVRIAATAAWAVTSLPMIVLPLTVVVPLVIAGLGIFVLTHVVAAVYIGIEARRRFGSAGRRLLCASAAGLVMAMAVGLSTVMAGMAGEAGGDLGRGFGLLAGALYIFAFLPPAWARTLGSAVTNFDFTEQLLESSFDEGASGVWTRLADLGRRTTGSTAALVVVGTAPEIVAFATDDDRARDALVRARLGQVPVVVDERRPFNDPEDRLARLARDVGAPYVSVLPFELTGGDPGAVVLLRERPSLFAADDHAILTALIDRARVFAERGEAMKQEAALAQRLSATVEALERAGQAKSDFLASMSHELRTPLSAIIGFSALMRDEPLEGDRRSIPDEWIEHVRRSGDHLLALINDVLDLTKIEAGRIELTREPFDLATALTESVEGLRPLADRKHIEMVLDAPAGKISVDRGRLRQIVYNLLSNAIKFTPEGGKVSVEARWHGSEARVAVLDTGVGIAASDLDHIFEEFRQVGDMKAREAGTGLGLALSRRLVEAHDGQMTVTSTPGAGSRFEFTLPDSRVPERIVDPVLVSGQAPSAGSTVLVIEDDPGAVRLLRTYLEGEGYFVQVAIDGEAGIAAARANPPGAIILDVLLPGIDGWEVLRRLKVDPELRDVPVMVATVVDERNVAMNLGAVDYFVKPVRREALLARLATYTFTTKVKERNIRVLVIDDDLVARDLVANALRPEGFEVVTAASGREGLELAGERQPDLVICDLIMPEMDGFEVVNRLAESDMPKDVPILILTGQDLTPADRERLNGKVAAVMAKDGDPRPALATWLRRAAAASGRRGAVAAA